MENERRTAAKFERSMCLVVVTIGDWPPIDTDPRQIVLNYREFGLSYIHQLRVQFVSGNLQTEIIIRTPE